MQSAYMFLSRVASPEAEPRGHSAKMRPCETGALCRIRGPLLGHLSHDSGPLYCLSSSHYRLFKRPLVCFLMDRRPRLPGLLYGLALLELPTGGLPSMNFLFPDAVFACGVSKMALPPMLSALASVQPCSLHDIASTQARVDFINRCCAEFIRAEHPRAHRGGGCNHDEQLILIQQIAFPIIAQRRLLSEAYSLIGSLEPVQLLCWGFHGDYYSTAPVG